MILLNDSPLNPSINVLKKGYDYNLKTIKKRPWFHYIKDLPSIHKKGRRDGYYNCWKAFIVKEVYDEINLVLSILNRSCEHDYFVTL